MDGSSSNVKALNCPNCGAALSPRGLGQTSVIACPSCTAIVDFSRQELEILQASQPKRARAIPLIPLGSRGKIEETVFEVLGFMLRSDGTGMYFWSEYLLFNPYKGFRWLVESDGHWSFVTPCTEKPDFSQEPPQYQGRPFSRFLSGDAVVQFVMGEFYWQVRAGDRTSVADYIAPPYMLSMEADGGEKVFSLGRYVSRAEICEAFPRFAGDFPSRSGVAPHQPFPFQHTRSLWALFAIALVAMLLFKHSPTNRQVFRGDYEYVASALRMELSPEFLLREGVANVEIAAHAPVDNNWLEADVTLQEVVTGEEYEGALEMAYYHGQDSDGSWTEGSQSASLFFGQVPEGQYRLVVEAAADPLISQMEYHVVVRRDAPYWGIFVLGVFVLLSIPAVVYLWKLGFERKRWAQSDYAEG